MPCGKRKGMTCKNTTVIWIKGLRRNKLLRFVALRSQKVETILAISRSPSEEIRLGRLALKKRPSTSSKTSDKISG